MGLVMRDIDIPNKYTDRKVRARIVEDGSDEDFATFYIEDIGWYPQANVEQFAHITKVELLDALARMGWLPDAYLKPKPLDPREAKIREVALAIYNTDAQDEDFDDQFGTYEEFATMLPNRVTAYRKNAEALIDAGLVKVDTE